MQWLHTTEESTLDTCYQYPSKGVTIGLWGFNECHKTFYGVSTYPNNDGAFPEVLCLPQTAPTTPVSHPLTAVL